MLVQFRSNIGSVDASQCGVDFTKCTKGARLEVSDEVGAKLIRMRLADEVKVEGIEEPEIKAVPVEKMIATAEQKIKEVKAPHQVVKPAVLPAKPNPAKKES